MTHYSPNAPVDWAPLSKLIKDSSPMISFVIIAFSLCSHESRAQHLCKYLAQSSRNLSESRLRRYCGNNNCDLGYTVPPTVVFSGTMPVILPFSFRPGLPLCGPRVNCALGQVCCNVPYVS